VADDVVAGLAPPQLEEVLEQPCQFLVAGLQLLACRSDLMPSSAPPMSMPCRAKSTERESGMPSRSVMTAMGSGAAKPDTRSNVPAALAASSRSPAVRSTRPA
jgi:hypothetical protein